MTTLWSSEELANHVFPTPAYLVEPMIPQGGHFILHGKPNVGKTQLILTLAQAINNGEPFLGRWPTRQGPVVVVQADMTGMIQQERLKKVVDVVELGDTYWVVEEDGATPMIDITKMRLLKSQLVKLMREIDPVLCVWDTLRKIHRLPENASETPITIYNAAQKILPSTTHGFLHHNRKESQDPDAEKHPEEDFMGSEQWLGACDASFSLRELSAPPKRTILQFHKARTAPEEEKTPIVLEQDTETILLKPLRSTNPAEACRAERWRQGT